MSPILWVACLIVFFIVGFLMVAFFAGRQMSEPQYNILHFLCTLCGALAGGFVTGEALFRAQGSFGSGTQYLITGTSGFALALVLWFFFPKFPKTTPSQTPPSPTPPPLVDSLSFSVPDGWTFEQMVFELVQKDGAVPDFDGLTAEEVKTPLRAGKLRTRTIAEAVRQLRSFALTPIREYDVMVEDSTFKIRLKV